VRSKLKVLKQSLEQSITEKRNQLK